MKYKTCGDVNISTKLLSNHIENCEIEGSIEGSEQPMLKMNKVQTKNFTIYPW